MSNLINHAKRELEAIGYVVDDIESQPEDPNKWIVENILELISVFTKQGHSGMSAPYCINMFEKLARFQPLTPLTGEDNEWNEVSSGLYQNKRCSNVFKDTKNGKAYDIEGKIFKEEDGTCYTSKDSSVFIDFPYTPKSEYVRV